MIITKTRTKLHKIKYNELQKRSVLTTTAVEHKGSMSTYVVNPVKDKTNHLNVSNKLDSTLELFYLQEFLGKLIALLFPASVMFYTFCYYHLYTLKKHETDSLSINSE